MAITKESVRLDLTNGNEITPAITANGSKQKLIITILNTTWGDAAKKQRRTMMRGRRSLRNTTPTAYAHFERRDRLIR